jgi:biopolymer transport protein ExbD
MKLSSRRISRDNRITLQMTSMIDVVFLLLIFFIVAASFVETERELKSAIQLDKSGVPSPFEKIVIDIVDRGDGIYVYRLGSEDYTDPDRLYEMLNQQPARSKAEGAFVRVADGAPFDMSATAISLSKKAKFISVSYIPVEPK